MRYFKLKDENENISRIDAAESNVSGGEEIQRAEHYAMRVAIRVFLNKEDPSALTREDWGLK